MDKVGSRLPNIYTKHANTNLGHYYTHTMGPDGYCAREGPGPHRPWQRVDQNRSPLRSARWVVGSRILYTCDVGSTRAAGALKCMRPDRTLDCVVGQWRPGHCTARLNMWSSWDDPYKDLRATTDVSGGPTTADRNVPSMVSVMLLRRGPD